MTGIRRALLPVLLAAAALTCAFAIQRSLACPVELPPQPLRTLYKLSERVVVARVGAKEVLKTKDQVAFVRVALHVTENVKGAPVQLLHLHQTELVVDAAAEAEEDVGEITVGAFSGRPIPRLKRGERYLFFLDPREEGDGYEVNDESYAIKQLSDDDLKVYLERMKELANLLREQPEDKHALVEWLVRCAEEPATRWEGAYELFESAEAATRGVEAPAKEEQGASAVPQASDETAATPAPDSVTDGQIEMPPRFNNLRSTPADPTLVPLLNAVQKQRLSDAFLASSPELNEGDDLLMLVVKDFGDPRFPGFVLARLHRFEDEAPYQAELWLRALTASLKNKQLIELSDSYTQDAAYYEWDEEAQTEAESPTAAAGDGTGAEEVSAEEAVEETVDPKVAAALEAASAERATLKRSAMLKAILTRVDLFVSTGQLAEAQP